MAQLSTYGGVIVPSPIDAATIPADLLSVVNQFCGTVNNPARVNAVVTSKAERDANYNGYPAGGIVVCPQLKTIWLSLGKVSNVQTWNTVYSDTGWITAGFSFPADFSAFSAGSVKARRKGPMNEVRVQAIYNGEDTIQAESATSTWPGNIADKTIVTIPSDFWPNDEQSSVFFSTYTGGVARLRVGGDVQLVTMATSSKIAPTQPVQTKFSWMAED